MVDPLLVTGKHPLHFSYKFIPHNTRFYPNRDPYTLLGILTPLGTSEVNLGVCNLLATLAALQLRLILKELHRVAAAGARCFENVVRLPESLVLSGTPNHKLFRSICSSTFLLTAYNYLPAFGALALILVTEELKTFTAAGARNLNNVGWPELLFSSRTFFHFLTPIFLRTAILLCPNHRQQHLKPFLGVDGMWHIGWHHDYLAGLHTNLSTSYGKPGPPVNNLDHRIIRARMFAEPLALIKSKQRYGADRFIHNCLADYRIGRIFY
jgi:hypothetical protein